MRTRTSRSRSDPARRPAAPAAARQHSRAALRLPDGGGWAALVVLAVVAGAEIFRLGFFADDFHFLDVARRIPVARAIGGEFGVWPWYRPLSRELYFAGVAAAGPAGVLVARFLSLAAVVGLVLLVDRVGRPLVGARAARIGAVLFATYAFTRFLASWASGFQDLLGMLLVLLAIDAWLRERRSLALAAAVLAPFAKETSVVVFPLLGAIVLAADARARRGRDLALLTGGLAVVAAIHLLVRASWKGGGSSAEISFTPLALLEVTGRALAGFVGTAPVLEPDAALLAVLAAGAAALALHAAARAGGGARGPGRPEASRDRGPGPSRRGAIGFLALAVGLGLLPLVGGNLMRLSAAHAYYAFPAAPWLALAFGAALARIRPVAVATVLLALLAGWNVAALGYRVPDLGTAPGWQFRRWDWPEAVRLSAISARLTEDLRSLLATRPESLAVLYTGLPAGSFFQTEDGPATRVALADPTIRSYWVNATPFGLVPGRARLVEFDAEDLHLHMARPGTPFAALVASSVAAGEPGAAWGIAACADSAERETPQLQLYRAAAMLLARGPEAYRQELVASGFGDSTGSLPAARAEFLLGPRPDLVPTLEASLRNPLDAEKHARLAEVFLPAGGGVSAAVELRIALALAPRPATDRLLLARALERTGNRPRAREAYEALATAAPGTALEDSARAGIERLDRLGPRTPAVPRQVLGRPISR